jgi:serine/threonine-protein kinase
MGEVYRAVDTRLQRTVALKVIGAACMDNPERCRRFLHEARAASALSHPNIVHIYEVGESSGVMFIAMEFVDGVRLADRIAGRPQPPSVITDLGAQVADALDEAHSKGIVHRDIKPTNVLVNTRGQAKVLDFGLAKAVAAESVVAVGETLTARITREGMIMGTLEYMSPEQALGRDVDRRSDIFSTGAVLYEMATGRPPFTGPTQTEILHAVISSEPEAISRLNYETPPELERIIRKCLEKDPSRRYQSARELMIDLRALERTSSSAAPVPVMALSRRKAVWGIACAGAVVAASVGGLWLIRGRWGAASIDSLAVLPFAGRNNDQNVEFVADALTERLINRMTQVPGLKVMARGTVFTYKGRISDPRQVAHDLRVGAVLTGRVDQRGQELIVQAELVKAGDGSELWGGQYRRSTDDLQAIERDIAAQVAARTGLAMTGDQRRRVGQGTSTDPETYRLYLQGRLASAVLSEENLRKAIGYYQQALAREPNYALAYAGLADAYGYLSGTGTVNPKNAMAQARAAATKALELDDSLGEAHNSLAIVHLWDWDFQAARREFERSVELNPGNAYDRHWYSHFLSATGRWEEATSEMRKAVELDPLSVMIQADLAFLLATRRQWAEAEAEARKAHELEARTALISLIAMDALIYTGWNRREQALAALSKLSEQEMTKPGGPVLAIALFAMLGKPERARELRDRLKETASRAYVPRFNFAGIAFALGENDRGFELLEEARRDRDFGFILLMPLPLFDRVRDDPRFAAIMHKVGLPDAAWR